MTTLASRCRAFTISTRCWVPTGRFSTRTSGSTARPYRLVEDDNAGLAVQSLHDLDALLGPDGKVLHEDVRVNGQAVSARELEHVLAGASPVEEAEDARPLHAEHDVLGDGEDRHQHEVD